MFIDPSPRAGQTAQATGTCGHCLDKLGSVSWKGHGLLCQQAQRRVIKRRVPGWLYKQASRIYRLPQASEEKQLGEPALFFCVCHLIKQYQEQAHRRLEEHAILAEDLGAEVIRTSSRDIAAKLIEIAKERQVTQIVLGQPARSRWEELLRGSVVNRLLRLNAEIDIHLVPGNRGEEE